MPIPVSGATITRRDLSDLANEYNTEQSQRGFVALDIMPMYEVLEQSGSFPKMKDQQDTRAQDNLRAARAAYDRTDYEFDDDTYNCLERGLENQIPDVERKRYRSLFDADAQGTRVVVDNILRGREKRVAALVQAQTANSVSVSWATAASATPQADVEAGIQSILDATGAMADTLVLPYKVMKRVLKTADVLENIKYTSADAKFGTLETKKQILADFFGVSRVVVPNAIYNSAKEGAAYSATDIWDDDYAFLCVTRNGDLRTTGPQWGRAFVWTEDVDGEFTVEMYREEQTRSDIVRCRTNDELKAINTSAGYLLSNLD